MSELAWHAPLTEDDILSIDENSWGDMLYLIHRRLPGSVSSSGWFIATMCGPWVAWDGPYEEQVARKRFDSQQSYLEMVLGHFGCLESVAPNDEPTN